MAQQDGQEDHRRRRRARDPAGRHLDRGLQVLRAEGRAGYEGAGRLLAGLRRADKCKTVAENQIAQGAQVLFQVAGGCGIGALKAADEADSGASASTPTSTTLGQARPDERDQARRHRRLPGGHAGARPASSTAARDLIFNLKNGGIGVGKINPAVPAVDNKLMNAYKAQIISRQAQGPDRRSRASRKRSRCRGAGRRPAPRRSGRLGSRAMDVTGEPVLEMRGITKAFPGIVANDHVDFELAQGRGARAARRERRRQVDADEHPLRALQARRGRDPASTASRSRSRSAKDAIGAGIGMVHQHFMLIPVMTVAENIVLGDRADPGRRPARRARRRSSASASCRSSSASRSTRRARSRTSPSGSSSASRS